MNKASVARTHNGIFLIYEKEHIPNIYNKMDGFR